MFHLGGVMHDQTLTYVLLGGLAIALLWAAITDLKSRIITNRLNIVITVGAPIFWWASGLSVWPDVAIQIGLAALTFAICCLFFALRQMGGGDVKLLSALALWFPPADFLVLVVLMALLGWLITLVMGIWGVAHSKVVGAKPLRDSILLVAFTLIAVNFASALLGGPRLALTNLLPTGSADTTIAVVAVAMLPVAILAIVTLASVRIIRRHEKQTRVPYGLAISAAGLWVLSGMFWPVLTGMATS